MMDTTVPVAWLGKEQLGELVASLRIGYLPSWPSDFFPVEIIRVPLILGAILTLWINAEYQLATRMF